MKNDKFVKTFVPNITITKSEDGGSEEDKKWYISGYATTDSVDSDGEVVRPEGIDYSYYKDNGYITYDHLHDLKDIVGEPVEDGISVDEHGLYLKGVLYKSSPVAQSIWKLSETLAQESLSNRSMGLSIEAAVKERDPLNPNIITKSTLLAVTITTHPANPDAHWHGIAKSALEGYSIDPAAMTDVSALRRESLDSALTTSTVANSISTLSFVMSRSNTEDILRSAEQEMRANGYLNRNAESIILLLGKGISLDEATDFINNNGLKGV